MRFSRYFRQNLFACVVSRFVKNFSCFYSVIEARDFSHFNQSAQALLKGYFITRE